MSEDVALGTFIKETLTQIIMGVKNAQEAIKGENAEINPKTGSTQYPMTTAEYPIHHIDFDIAISVTNDAKAEAKIGVLSGILGMAVKGELKESNVGQHRIKFHVPISYTYK